MTHSGEAAPRGSDGRLRQGGRTFLLALYTALRSLKLYPVENTTVQKALDELDATARSLLAVEADLEIRLAGDFIFVNATRLRLELDNFASFSHILAMLRAFDIGALRVLPEVDRREWQVFLSLLLALSQQGEPDTRFDELTERLGAGNVVGIGIERSSLQDQEAESEEQRQAAKRVYSQGVAVTKDVMTGVRLGHASSVKKVKRAVQLIVDQVLNNETSLVGLTTLRDYDEYSFTHSVNVCIFSVALGKKIGLSRLQLYDLGMAALLHDVGKARVPLAILHKTTGLDEQEWRVMRDHPWLGALTLFHLKTHEEMPFRAILVAHEHHMKTDLTGYPKAIRPRKLHIFSRLVAVADGFDAATTRRTYQTVPIEPDQVLREMMENPKRGYDALVVKGLVNLLGVYPVGTCVILDTFEIGLVTGPDPEGQQFNRPLVRIAVDVNGATVPPPGLPVSLAEKDEAGSFRRSIVKVTNADRYGLTVGNYFV